MYDQALARVHYSWWDMRCDSVRQAMAPCSAALESSAVALVFAVAADLVEWFAAAAVDVVVGEAGDFDVVVVGA